ncbi:MAG: hypothetical protein IK026_03180 [Eubacteriaceae bacterium]|nr:hypothetical protein [Eubacteriaceae bacterium]
MTAVCHRRAQTRIGWEADDSFRAICLSGKGYARSEMTMSYLCTMLEETFPTCVAVSRGETIYCLHDRTREDRTDFSGDLAIFLRDNLLQAGLSCVFTGLENCGPHFREAEAALYFGEQTDDSFGCIISTTTLSHTFWRKLKRMCRRKICIPPY